MTNESTAIAAIPALAAVTVSRSPVTNYLAHLESEGSKTTARSCLRMVANAISLILLMIWLLSVLRLCYNLNYEIR